MNLLSRYHLYLYSLGYSIKSIDDKHCSITDYTNAVEKIACTEKTTVENLADKIELIFQQYSKGGEKNSLLPQNDNERILKGLEHFKEFISLCNKRK